MLTFIEVIFRSLFLLHSNWCYKVKLAVLPWYMRWGRFCEQHLQELGPLLCPDSSSERTLHGHWGTAPTHLLHLYTPAGLLYLCEVWELIKYKNKQRWIEYHKLHRVNTHKKQLVQKPAMVNDYFSCGFSVVPLKTWAALHTLWFSFIYPPWTLGSPEEMHKIWS